MDENLKLGWLAEEYKYITSKNHLLIGVGTGANIINNIGEQGENLTIAILMMNRASLTLRLMESIKKYLPNFKGEFLIGDNGSEESELKKVEVHFSDMPFRCRCVKFGKNWGVAGGRNRLYKEVRTDWLFQLDNDVYFIDNPLPKIKEDLGLLGTHFLCVPVLNEKNHEAFVYGGHLYVEQEANNVSIGGGSAYLAESVKNRECHQPFLCTFLSGCSSIINKNTFFSLGGYDEGMFVGFEDTEFSIRVFQAGYKIGTCGMACVIHDHPKPTNNSDVHYEKQRFSNVKLLEAARYFENKHKIHVWNPTTEEWVNQRLRELLDEELPKEENSRESECKKKILLVVDKPGWALDNIAKQIIKNCSDRFEFRILYLVDIDNIWAVFYLGEEYDLIHFLWRSWLVDCHTDYGRGYAKRWGMDPDEFYQKYILGKAVCTSVYDHLFLDDDFRYTQSMFSNEDTPVKAYSVSSNILKEIYDNDQRIRIKPRYVVTDGVDLQLFYPRNLERFYTRNAEDCLTVGWAGNSMWSAEKEDFKGLHTILKPAIKELQDAGYNIRLELCDSREKMIPHSEMPMYYAKIDLYVCMSKIEGTPNPILECMACGVPFVSTRVGIVPEAAGELQSQFILKERSIKCLKRKLIEIMEHPEWLQKLSEENICSIKSWDWKDRARGFIPMWEELF